MRKFIAKNIGYPLQDMVKRTQILNHRNFLEKTQLWSKEELHNFQLDKMKKLVKYANEFVPYYIKLFKDIGLNPGDIKSHDDFKNIPVLTKQIAREQNENLYSVESFNFLKKGMTGGTTGPPLFTRSNIEARSYVWGAYYRWYGWMGIEVGDQIAELWGASRVSTQTGLNLMKQNTVSWLKNTIRINSFNMNENTFPSLIKVLQKRKPAIIKGYLTALLQLAKYIKENKIKGISPIAISTTSETLLPPYRKYLEEVFQCKIYDQYGCGECQSVAFECSAQIGLHVTTEHVFLEILDNKFIDAGFNEGNIVLTDLDNYAMPFIRYLNGDVGRLSETECTCGLPYPLLKEILGRAADTIKLRNGSQVHGVFFTDILFEKMPEESKKVSRFQAYQVKPGDLEFRMEVHENLTENFKTILTSELIKHFNKVDLVTMKEIPTSSSGKFRYVLSEIKN
jgi:phenylacetate-CoA ligase